METRKAKNIGSGDRSKSTGTGQSGQPLYSVAEIAQLGGVSTATIRRLIRTGLLRAFRVGKMFIVTHEQLEQISDFFGKMELLIAQQCNKEDVHWEIVFKKKPGSPKNEEVEQ